MKETDPIHRVSLLGGMDPSGGAGILRDVWSCEDVARKAGAKVLLDALCTGLTRQSPGTPAQLLPVRLVREAQRLAGLRGTVWKVGMLPSVLLPALVAHLQASKEPPRLIVDPLQKASAGGQLGATPQELALLWSHCDWVTPNREEALALGARPGVGDGPWRLPRSLGQAGGCWIKSAARQGGQIVDELHLGEAVFQLRQPALKAGDPRGTGCALASALAFYLSYSPSLPPLQRDASLWGWEQDDWRRAPPLSPPQRVGLAPALWAWQWLRQARTHATRRGSSWLLPTRF